MSATQSRPLALTPVDAIRNVAIIAHVDHGKTTLVDAMLRQSGAFREGAELTDRVMDSMDLERERGITILSKNTAITYRDTKINIVDTPGHADFGGEVERALTMVDGVLLLVDASEGPLPQTRFVLRKALELDHRVLVVINKVDRPDARLDEVTTEIEDLFLDLEADDHHLDFPIVYASARSGFATTDLAAVKAGDYGTDLRPLMDLLLDHVPAPLTDPEHPFQAQVTNLDASQFVGRLAVCRVHHGSIRKNQTIAWCRSDGTIETAKVATLYGTENFERVEIEEAGPGEIIAVAGLEEVTIGETLADSEDPRPLPVIVVDDPALSMTIGVNLSPLAGSDGDKLTARLVKTRLDAELIGNVSIRVEPTERPDTWEVLARGELQLAVLVETMRREGFELTVGKPQVVTTEVDGVIHEPVERLSVDIPDDHVGSVTNLMASRKGNMVTMEHHAQGWVRMEYLVPARGLIGFRTEFMTETRGTGIAHHVFDGWIPWAGEIRARASGSLVADRVGSTTAYAIVALQERATMFVTPGTEVYEGMVVGENTRTDDMDVNITKEKKQTNMRAAAADTTVTLNTPRLMDLDRALEFISQNECVEVTPDILRIRKVELDPTKRARAAKKAKQDT
jgi:GTP-binding protein